MRLVVEIRYMRQVNWSLLRAGIPLVPRLAVRNAGNAPIRDLALRLSLTPYLDSGPLPLPLLAPGETHTLKSFHWIKADYDAVMRLADGHTAHLQLDVGTASAQCPLSVLPPDAWRAGVVYDEHNDTFKLDATMAWANATIDLPPGGVVTARDVEEAWRPPPPLQAAAAALIQPGHPEVDAVKRTAVEKLATIAGDPRVSLDEWVSGAASQRRQVVQAVFMALLARYPRAFHDIEKYGLNDENQRVRLAHEALNVGAGRHGATCIDYALFACGVLEACGLAPLFVLVGTGPFRCHALAGCRLEGTAPAHTGPLLTNELTLRRLVDQNHLCVVDVTEFSKGVGFIPACRRGAASLSPPNAFCYALDVAAAREQYGIAPLPPPPPSNGDPDDKGRTIYLEKLYRRCQLLPLSSFGENVDLDKDEDLTLEKVYVGLTTTTVKEVDRAKRATRDDEAKRRLSAQDAVARARRVVLLGDPGAGKSTFVRQLAGHQAEALLGRADPPPGIDADLLPVLLTLLELTPDLAVPGLDARSGDRRRTALAERVCAHAVDSLKHLNAEVFADGLRAAFVDGRVLLVLDGLDEVPVSSRERIREAVAAVLGTYHFERIIVTCRIRSYEGAARLNGFDHHTLAPFDEDQIEAFARGWYRAQQDLKRVTPEEAVPKADDLARAATSDQLRELAQNPMLMTTMAIIHQRNVGLPRERVLLYKEAVHVLLIRWQKERFGASLGRSEALAGFLNSNEQVLSALRRLAYETHRLEATGEAAGLPWMKAIALLGDHLHGNLNLAQEFLDYVDQRAGLLIGRGGEKKTDVVYSFPHRTFQEYLAGSHLFRERPRKCKALLMQYAEEGDFWTVAVQLGAEELFFVREDKNTLLDLAYPLCPRSLPPKPGTHRTVLWSADMAVLVGAPEIERDTGGVEEGKEYLERLRRHLVALLGGALPARERAEAGRLLATLGDPRAEVLVPEKTAFCLVPGGPFQMGSPDSDEMAYDVEKPLHEVSLPYDFWMARYPVTVAQYEAFVQSGGYAERRYWTKIRWDDRKRRVWTQPARYGGAFEAANHPVVGVSWYEAWAYSRWLEERLREAGLIPPGWWVGLPSEAEWGKAARGGLSMPAQSVKWRPGDSVEGLDLSVPVQANDRPARRYPWGDAADENRMNYVETGIGSTSAVGCFPGGVSPYGVEELSGNMWEWTRSLRKSYPYDPLDGREDVTAGDDKYRVLRGGSFNNNDHNTRAAYRNHNNPNNRNNNNGFRIVLLTLIGRTTAGTAHRVPPCGPRPLKIKGGACSRPRRTQGVTASVPPGI